MITCGALIFYQCNWSSARNFNKSQAHNMLFIENFLKYLEHLLFSKKLSSPLSDCFGILVIGVLSFYLKFSKVQLAKSLEYLSF